MLTIPLYIFLFIYFGFLLFCLFFVAVDIGNLFRTGTFTLASFFATFLFLAFVAIVIWATYTLLVDIDWQQPVLLWNNAWFGSTFPVDQVLSPFKINPGPAPLFR